MAHDSILPLSQPSSASYTTSLSLTHTSDELMENVGVNLYEADLLLCQCQCQYSMPVFNPSIQQAATIDAQQAARSKAGDSIVQLLAGENHWTGSHAHRPRVTREQSPDRQPTFLADSSLTNRADCSFTSDSIFSPMLSS